MKKCAILLLITVLTGMACQKEVKRNVIDTRSNADLLSLMKINFNFSLFYHALQVTGQDSLFGNGNHYTIWMPDNVAFANIGINLENDLDRMNKDSLRLWVRFHILPGSIPSTDIPRTINSPYTSLSGQMHYVTNNGSSVRVNGDVVISADHLASDGVIHVLTRPLELPYPSVKDLLLANANFSYFTTGLKKFGLLDQLAAGGPYTVIAPLNSAYEVEHITLDSIEHMDTLRFKKYLYGVSLVSGPRIFVNDFADPIFGTGGTGLAFFGDVGVLENIFSGGPDAITWDVLDRHRSTALDPTYGTPENPCADPYCSPVYLGPSFSGPLINGWPPYIVDWDHPAVNGVVHGLNDILVYPDSVRIK